MAEKDTYIKLLEESDEHIGNSHFREAIRSAGLGIELLLKDLLDELCKDMESVDRSRAKNLKGACHKLRQKYNNKIPFGVLVKTYQEKNIFRQLTEISGFEFTSFTTATLYSTQNIRNEATHSREEQNKSNARIVRDRFKRMLIQSARLPDDWTSEQEKKAATTDEPESEKTPVENLASDWREKWSQLIDEWLTETDQSLDKVLVGSLMDFLMLVTGLISDQRVSAVYRPQLLLAVNYVILSADLIPENKDNVYALRDDVAVLVFTLQWLLHNTEISEEVMLDHWVQTGDPVEAIHYMAQHIRTSHDSLFDDEVWATIQPVAEHGPEALWNNSKIGQAPKKDALENVYQLIGEIEGATDWENKWRVRIIEWVKSSRNSGIADLVMLAPDLLALVKRLLEDNRVAAEAKPRLLAAVTYVITPWDLIPEALVGVVGLTDDVGALVLISLWLSRNYQIDEAILREHWTRASNPMDVLQNLYTRLLKTDSVFGQHSGVWNQLLERFSLDEGNEITFVDRVRLILRRSRP